MEKAKLWTKEYIITTCGNFLIALNHFLLLIVMSGYTIGKFGVSESLAGLTASIFVVGAIAARLLTGRWIARVGYKKMLLGGAVGNVVFTFAYFFADSVPLLLAVRILSGVTFGIITTSAATIIADITPQERRGEGIGYYSLSQILAIATGPFLGMLLSTHGSFNTIIGACLITAIVNVAIITRMTLKKAHLPAETAGEFGLAKYIELRVISISVITMLIYICYSSVVSFLAVYAKQISLETSAGFFFVIYAIFVLVSRPFVGKLFDRRGEHVIMYPAIVMFSIGLCLFSQSYSGGVLLSAAACIGLGLGSIQSSTQAIAVKVTPQRRMGLANSTYFMFCDVGMGIGPVLVGFLIPFTGYRGMYLCAAGIAFVCLALYYLLHHQRYIIRT